MILALVVVLVGGFYLYRHRATIFQFTTPASPPPITADHLGQTAAPLPPAATAVPTVPSESPAPAAPPDPALLAQQLREFFTHLDNQEYIRAYGLKGGSQSYLGQLLHQILDQPPVVKGEADDRMTMLKNSAHFYRVLGPKNIALLKEILATEGEGLEPLLATCYSWSQLPVSSQSQEPNLVFPGKKIYEYAGFFVNTLGGQSYLLRRSPKVRVLIQYYSLLIIDRANQELANRHGITIKRAVERARQELGAADFLADQAHYLTTLEELGSRAH